MSSISILLIETKESPTSFRIVFYSTHKLRIPLPLDLARSNAWQGYWLLGLSLNKRGAW